MSAPTSGARRVEDLLERPVVVAPMGGGPSTPALVAAASAAGALGFLAAAYKTAAEVEQQIREVRAATSRPFGVNVFVAGAPTQFVGELSDYARELEPEASRLGVELGRPVWDDDFWSAKADLLVDTAPAAVSFTFGCPDRALIAALQRRGTLVVVTVTTADEADHAVAAGADCLCAQGIEAGAHRGSYSDDDAGDDQLSTLDLVRAIRRTTSAPVLAAGGVARPQDVRAALAAGATAVQAGTAFLRCDESGANRLHKAALVDPAFDTTALTRAFTGRRARGLVNRFLRDHANAPRAYPEIHHLTRPLRAAAIACGDADGTNLWAGVGHRHARAGPAAAVVEWLCGG